MYFEDRGGDGAPILLHGGLLDSVADVRASSVAAGLPEDESHISFAHVSTVILSNEPDCSRLRGASEMRVRRTSPSRTSPPSCSSIGGKGVVRGDGILLRRRWSCNE